MKKDKTIEGEREYGSKQTRCARVPIMAGTNDSVMGCAKIIGSDKKEEATQDRSTSQSRAQRAALL